MQQAKIQLQENALRRKIDAWIKIQEVYVPSAALIRLRAQAAAVEGKKIVPASAIPLLLLSALPPRTLIETKFKTLNGTFGKPKPLTLSIPYASNYDSSLTWSISNTALIGGSTRIFGPMTPSSGCRSRSMRVLSYIARRARRSLF